VRDLPNVAALVDEVGAVSWVRSRSVERTLGRLLSAWRERRDPTATDLLPDLDDEPVRRVLTRVLARDDDYSSERLELATQECMLRLRLDFVERQRRSVLGELGELERTGSGDPAPAMSLMQESLELDKEREQLQQLLRQGR